ncbi:carboxypeptidase M32 [Planctomicrobium piriforme]|uniref:Metal-dependent carboxypeptidase n=1 Tax=Planctomicrobium piriforme TaxID=1576369 RepID=A0A1I3C0J9_9PLAN|nr:carboxypeptidase M32 [Planctomicrobium piriforme]SFH67973.1 carboxypeptidase Taq [Planctomicrobium piriforme]
METLPAAYTALVERLKELAVLRSCASLLSWDEQTHLPPHGAEHRANQLSLLAGLCHDRATDPAIGDLLAQLDDVQALGGHAAPVAANVREARRNYERSTRLPRRLVEELSRVCTLSQQAWVEARHESNFAKFQPWLTQMIDLKREEADALGSSTGVRYDALLDDYEPGATVAQIQGAFSPLRETLVELVSAIRSSGVQPDISILERHYPTDRQKSLSLDAARMIGFDFQAGRLDIAAHPFCSSIGPGDCRMTTRYNEYHFSGSLFGTLHESGHGIYEQGLSTADFGLGTGEACSLGIHESQSRMWENLVGRSLAFWEFFYPQTQSAFPDALGNVSLQQFHQVINDVRPSWIRVEADEVTYNLHIMLRFEIEQALISGALSVADVPGAWNDAFSRYFGMTPPNDALGCLQDVHWGAGLIGYFPTYSLGNMYASQFFEKANADLGDLNEQFRRGEFHPLREWLKTNIHSHGKRYHAPQLVEVVTGQPLSSEPLLRHLRGKFGQLYRL